MKMVATLCAVAGVLALALLWPKTSDPLTCAQAPSVISTAGHYCLWRDMDHGIVISADNVTLDMLGHCIRGTTRPEDASFGVYIPHGRSDITIRNGCITGFMYGVMADDGHDRARRSSRIALHAMELADNWFRGATIFADDASVTNSLIRNIGGSTHYRDAYAFGVELRGNRCRAENNILRDIYPVGEGEGVGISVSEYNQKDCLIRDNLIENERLPTTGRTFGLWIASPAFIDNNIIVNMTFGISPRERVKPENVDRNIVVGEQCRGGEYSIAMNGTDTIYFDLDQSPCSME